MKPSRAERQRRAARKAARRRRRLAIGRRPRRRVVDKNAAEGYIEQLMAPIRAQSKPRQKALDAEAAQKRKARRHWLPDRQRR